MQLSWALSAEKHFSSPGGPAYDATVAERMFQFITPAPMIDADLELVPPHEQLIDAMLAECTHPLSRAVDPRLADTSRLGVDAFLKAAPGGRYPGDPRVGLVPAYHFWMQWRDEATQTTRVAGGISVRIGQDVNLEYYAGHIGYHVFPPAQGRHFAERACRLVLPLLRHYGVRPTWITANPDNLPSRRTCERLGAAYVDTVPLPATHPFYLKGERLKCRYRWDT